MALLNIALLILLVKCAWTIGTPRPGFNFDLAGTYHVDFTTDEDGGCKSQQNKITRAWNEVPVILDTAIDAMEDLQTPFDQLSGTDAQNEWKRKADTFFTLFGAQIPSEGWTVKGGVYDPDVAATSVWRMFRKFFQEHQVPDGAPAPKYWLKCSDNWLQYLGPDALDPTDDTNTRKIRQNAEAVAISGGNEENGIYYAKSSPNGQSWFWPRDTKPKQKHPLCREKTLNAVTLTNDETGTRIITFCPGQFTVANWQVTGPAVTIQRKDDFSKRESAIALTWIHEMGHYIGNWRDPQVTVKSRTKLSALAKEETVYGFENCVLNGEQQPQTAIETPETYCLFAGAMVWSNFWWITGKAQTAVDIAKAGNKRFKFGSGSGSR